MGHAEFWNWKGRLRGGAAGPQGHEKMQFLMVQDSPGFALLVWDTSRISAEGSLHAPLMLRIHATL